MRQPAVLLAAALAMGCTGYRMTTEQPPPPHVMSSAPPNVGQICVVRPHSVASLAPIVVWDNGRLVGLTKGPTYFCYLAEPGPHEIASTYGDDIDKELGTDQVVKAKVSVEPSGRYFLHHDVRNPLLLSVGWVSESAAQPMIDVCRYAQLVEVPGDETLPQPDHPVPAARK